MQLRDLHPRVFFLETWRDLDSSRTDANARVHDMRPLWAMVTAGLCLTLMEYLGHSDAYDRFLSIMHWPLSHKEALTHLKTIPKEHFTYPLYRFLTLFYDLGSYVWWSGFRVLGYFLIPACVVRFVFRNRLINYGLETRGFREHGWVYALLYLIVLVAVIGVSFLGEFSSYYPFYKQSTRSLADLLLWEVLYAAQFFSLEFFFRGFWLQALRPTLGSGAIFTMLVPYCMIHFGKPWMETIAAILAGLVLGTLAMRTRSIWSGFLIHVSVAVTMDLAAILQTSRFPVTVWPAAGY